MLFFNNGDQRIRGDQHLPARKPVSCVGDQIANRPVLVIEVEFLGRPDDIIETPTEAQKIIYGETRRRIPELWDVDNPLMAGIVQNQDSYMNGKIAQRAYNDKTPGAFQEAMDEFENIGGDSQQPQA